jgi:hypothetical protein
MRQYFGQSMCIADNRISNIAPKDFTIHNANARRCFFRSRRCARLCCVRCHWRLIPHHRDRLSPPHNSVPQSENEANNEQPSSRPSISLATSENDCRRRSRMEQAIVVLTHHYSSVRDIRRNHAVLRSQANSSRFDLQT